MSQHLPPSPPSSRFHKVLVANRGEIARRIFRTLREMGFATVAVFSDADRDAPHVHDADEAVRLGPATASESYLDIEAVIGATRATGAGAIHPGYGFLAENAGFAERCREEGIVFIGPSPEAIRRMGDKAEAKELAAKAGVPVLEGFPVAGLDTGAVRGKAAALGYPLLVKAAAGGGGKGMRAVRGAVGLDEALAGATREAESAFGDGSLLVERLLASPRHVEVQILGDVHGRIVHLFERDCSVQRRHQKVFEEAPSPAVDTGLRERLGEAALALARTVEYAGAGTVEFLLDSDGSFYFLEMNTRLQVEHPVTEMVTGLDLVRLQVEIAQGRPLELDPDRLALSGHAVEARLYAEDPDNDFLPATGTVSLWNVPEIPGLRIDGGVEAGSAVGVHYDPLLAKVIAHGRDRDEALRRLHRGLSELAVGGLVTNRDFLLQALEHDVFRRGEATTSFLAEHLPPEARLRPMDPEILAAHAIAATLHLWSERRREPSPLPAGIPSGWRNNRWRPQEQGFELAGEGPGQHLGVRYIAREDDRFEVDVLLPNAEDPREHAVRLVSSEDVLLIEIDGVRRRFRVGRRGERSVTVHGLGRASELATVPRFPERRSSATTGAAAAPMTGKVVEVLVEEGDRVEAGQTLLVLEAMKMEHRLKAETDGLVETVKVEAGQMVDPDEVLVVVVPEEGDASVG